MADDSVTSLPMGSGGATADDINTTLQNIARQLGLQAQSFLNANPAASTATSPAAYGFNALTNTATTVLAANANRYGIIFHNPSTADTTYVYPTSLSSTPTTATVGGAVAIFPGGTFALPSSMFSNVNGAWAAFSANNSTGTLTIMEFL